MPLALATLVLGVVAVVLVAAFLTSAARGSSTRTKQVRIGARNHVRYRVPHGQDPAAVLAALHGQGFDAVPSQVGSETEVLVPVRRGDAEARDRIRAAIRDHAGSSLEDPPSSVTGDVRFTDE